MHSSLSLQLSLFRSQKSLIRQAVQSSSTAFQAYERRYRRLTRRFETPIPLRAVDEAVAAADIVYVGDYHTLRSAQQSYLRLVQRAVAAGRPVVIALEFVEGRHQSEVDAFLEGKLSERAFLTRIGHPYTGEFDIWPNFRPIFELARREKIPVLAIDKRAGGPKSLQRRDAYAATRIAKAAGTPERPQVLVLMGQYHIAPCHLPLGVEVALGETSRRSLIVYQNCESVWWTLARGGQAGNVEAVRIREGELCLVHTSPLLCQQSFLDYLEAESGDAPLTEGGVVERFRKMAQLIARFAGVRMGTALRDVAVITPGDPDALELIRTRARFTPRELEQVRRQILARESYYIPRARAAYLASLSLNHAAEEAAHFVRHAAIGARMDAPRRPSDAFYARCMEEALGFFGSRLVNPRRHCQSVDEWATAFTTRKGEERQIAAFLLAHKAAEAEGADEAARLIPLRRDRLFNAVSHGLGYLLGDALHRAFEDGRVTRAEVKALFADPLADPRAAYFAWTQRVGA